MKITDLNIKGLKLIELQVFYDSRGFFVERFNTKRFAEEGLPVHFTQDNHSRSLPNVVRGLHFQTNPAQSKFVGVVRGKIWDVAVDLRPNSSTFGQYRAMELSDSNSKLLWIPSGFAHGFCVLGDEPADVMYKVDNLYSPTGDGGIRWNDSELNIPWPVKNAIVSDKDQKLQSFAEYRAKPANWG
jgi:dTDP-4-dehydrorhamnose 3,5-epimerase